VQVYGLGRNITIRINELLVYYYLMLILTYILLIFIEGTPHNTGKCVIHKNTERHAVDGEQEETEPTAPRRAFHGSTRTMSRQKSAYAQATPRSIKYK